MTSDHSLISNHLSFIFYQFLIIIINIKNNGMLSDFTRALDQLSLNIPNSKNDKKISFTT